MNAIFFFNVDVFVFKRISLYFYSGSNNQIWCLMSHIIILGTHWVWSFIQPHWNSSSFWLSRPCRISHPASSLSAWIVLFYIQRGRSARINITVISHSCTGSVLIDSSVTWIHRGNKHRICKKCLGLSCLTSASDHICRISE